MILIIHHAECTHIHVFLLTLPAHVAACHLPEDIRSQILSNEFCEVKIRGEEKEKKECGEKQPTALYMSSALPAASRSAEQVLLPLAAADHLQRKLILRKRINCLTPLVCQCCVVGPSEQRVVTLPT